MDWMPQNKHKQHKQDMSMRIALQMRVLCSTEQIRWPLIKWHDMSIRLQMASSQKTTAVHSTAHPVVSAVSQQLLSALVASQNKGLMSIFSCCLITYSHFFFLIFHYFIFLSNVLNQNSSSSPTPCQTSIPLHCPWFRMKEEEFKLYIWN